MVRHLRSVGLPPVVKRLLCIACHGVHPAPVLFTTVASHRLHLTQVRRPLRRLHLNFQRRINLFLQTSHGTRLTAILQDDPGKLVPEFIYFIIEFVQEYT